MSTPLLILLTSVLTLVVFCLGMLAHRWWLRHRTTDEIRMGEKRCSDCLAPLPVGTCRTSTGQWLCRDCKGKAS